MAYNFVVIVFQKLLCTEIKKFVQLTPFWIDPQYCTVYVSDVSPLSQYRINVIWYLFENNVIKKVILFYKATNVPNITTSIAK